MDEIWKDIPDTLYSVSNMGRVASRKWGKWRILRPWPDGSGYSSISIHYKGYRQDSKVHILVAEAFLGPRPSPKHQANHIDGIRTNPRADNLEWVTSSGNQRHRFDVLKHGNPRGEANGFSKLTEAKVREIRVRRAAGEKLVSIAVDYGIDFSTVSDIANGRRWAWLI